jgi:hypothetical protein
MRLCHELAQFVEKKLRAEGFVTSFSFRGKREEEE